jgi:signal transduction histidine kinase
VEAHGGTIGAITPTGGGTRMRVRIPPTGPAI